MTKEQINTLVEIREAMAIHRQAIADNDEAVGEDAHLGDVIEGMNISLTKLDCLLKEEGVEVRHD